MPKLERFEITDSAEAELTLEARANRTLQGKDDRQEWKGKFWQLMQQFHGEWVYGQNPFKSLSIKGEPVQINDQWVRVQFADEYVKRHNGKTFNDSQPIMLKDLIRRVGKNIHGTMTPQLFVGELIELVDEPPDIPDHGDTDAS